MSNRSVEELLERIRREAEENGVADEVRFVRTWRLGDEIRQGDIYLYPVEPDLRVMHHGRDTLQLAPGDSPGSRHIVVGDATAFDPPRQPDPLQGPLLHARSRVVLTHPEHADISLPAGWYEVRYQRDYSAPQRVQPSRVID